jgi:hypothetical protein
VNAASALSRMWRRLTLRLRVMRQMPESLHVPAATAVGVNQQPQGSGGDPSGHPGWSTRRAEPLMVLVVNETDHDVEVAAQLYRDKLRIWVRDA